MGVDEHFLRPARARAVDQLPDLPDEKLLPKGMAEKFTMAASPASPVPKPEEPVKKPAAAVGSRELRSEIRKLTSVINELLNVFSKAHKDIQAEPTEELNSKIDKLVEQNEEIARALLLLLELHREHLPKISKNARVSSPLRLRKPARSMFSRPR